MRTLLTIALLCAPLIAQIDGPMVSPSGGPPPIAYTTLMFYDSGSNLEYVCQSRSTQPLNPLTITNIIDSSTTSTVTATAHGLAVGNQVVVSGSATAALNGTYRVITVADANTFTITTSGLADATYTDATVSTTAPRTSAAQWSVMKLTYSGASLTAVQWARGSTGLGNICDSRTALVYQ